MVDADNGSLSGIEASSLDNRARHWPDLDARADSCVAAVFNNMHVRTLNLETNRLTQTNKQQKKKDIPDFDDDIMIAVSI